MIGARFILARMAGAADTLAAQRIAADAGASASTRMPDLFIVGAPGCGTTFLHEALGTHPQIFMSATKEPSYFCTDLDSGSEIDGRIFTRDLDPYLSLFSGARDAQWAGESSPFYLYSTVAARGISEASPDARIIIMLRHPADMIHYLHARKYVVGSEDLARFEDALAAEVERRAGRRLPANAWNVKALQYRAVGRYSEQVERYLRTFTRDRIHVLIFEEFQRDPQAAYLDVLHFLGLEQGHLPPMERVNPSLVVRSDRLHRLLLTPMLRKGFRRVAPNALRITVRKLIDRVNARPGRSALDPELRARLHQEFTPDMERLGALLGRDLSAVWR